MNMDSMFNRKLDHTYYISRMNYFEWMVYDFIDEGKKLKIDNHDKFVDKLISTCMQVDMIVRERLYFPKQQ